ncbi:MAG: amino acid ABC transporter permease [Acidimicrobiia bacterium]|nr:amino acid ABC transporter permease [Acidimicrobiia bacterium]MDH4307009.1 amino acid ABC transporter permease [Acidimicrobiia bacterium]
MTTPSWMEALALKSASIPFRRKLVIVWAVIFGVMGVVFALARFDTDWMRRNFLFIATGLRTTVFIAVAAIILAIVLALLGALGRLSKNPIAFGLTGFYTSFFRGTPLIVQMFLIYFALPQMGRAGPDWLGDLLILDAVPAGILALGLNYGAYMTEIFRAGIQSVSGGQTEAAGAIGMNYAQTMRRVVLPQAIRVIIPPTGNEFIAMMKDTALVSFLGATASQLEVFRKAQLLGRADNRNLEAFIVSALLYWGLTTVFTYFQGKLERRMGTGYTREGQPVRKAAAHG